MEGVSGSIPLPPTTEKPKSQYLGRDAIKSLLIAALHEAIRSASARSLAARFALG
jgi:hypothetical protein